MSIRRNRVPFVVAVCMGLAAPACGYGQEQQDQDLLFALHHLTYQLWETYLAGTPAGDEDKTFTQDGGGTLHVGGITTGSGPFSIEWTFTHFAAEDDAGADLVLDDMTGTIAEDGDWNDTIGSSSDDLVVRGTLTREGFDPVTLDGPLAYSGNFTSTGGWGSVNGRPEVDFGDTSGDGGGGGAECSAYPIECGKVTNGAEVVGGIVPVSCSCPDGTTFDYVDSVTEGGPYNFCVCN